MYVQSNPLNLQPALNETILTLYINHIPCLLVHPKINSKKSSTWKTDLMSFWDNIPVSSSAE